MDRADWRFFLPAGGSDRPCEHLVIVGGSAETAETARDLCIARRITTRGNPADPADAVVILAGADESLEQMGSQLRDGGVLYWEIDRRRRGQRAVTPARAMRRVRRLGLQPAGTYWVKPGFPDRDMYLPLGASGALQWYLDSLYRATTAPRRALKRALGALMACDVGLDAVAPCFAITASRGEVAPFAVLEHAHRHGLCAAGMRPLVLAHGRAEWNRLAVLLFEPEASVPTAILKLPRTARFNRQTADEHHALTALAARLSERLRRSIPASRLFHWNGLAVSMETCVPGSALTTRSGAVTTRSEDFEVAARWLTAFHSETIIERVPARAWLTERLIQGQAAAYAATFGLSGGERHLLSRLEEAVERVPDGDVPVVWQHTDFGPWNIYRDGARVSVIDWEVARHGPALVDLLYFAAHWDTSLEDVATVADRFRRMTPMLRSAAIDDGSVAWMQRPVAEYMQRLGVGAALVPFLLVYMVLEQALERAARSASFEPGLGMRRNNPYIGWVDELVRLTDTLFADEVCRAA